MSTAPAPGVGPGVVPSPGLPMTAAMHYTSTMVLFTAMDPVETVVDGAPPGPRGRLFIVPVNKPTKVPHEAGRFILDHLGYTGVVRVNEEETLDEEGNVIGLSYDVETARQESLAKGKEHDEIRFRRFVADMMADYVSRKDGKSLAPPPPPDVILRVIERRGYKLQDYGIKPVGFEDPADLKQKAIEDENRTLKAQMADLNSKFELMLRQQADDRTGNRAADKEAEAPAPKGKGKGKTGG